jgi:hypothetical protein
VRKHDARSLLEERKGAGVKLAVAEGVDHVVVSTASALTTVEGADRGEFHARRCFGASSVSVGKCIHFEVLGKLIDEAVTRVCDARTLGRERRNECDPKAPPSARARGLERLIGLDSPLRDPTPGRPIVSTKGESKRLIGEGRLDR